MSSSPTSKTTPRVFVFGSNLRGVHGAGAAKAALLYHGAKPSQGIGLQGNSYAIPTKDEALSVLPLPAIRKHVEQFILFAKEHPDKEFQVTQVGCGFARLSKADMAEMFTDAPDNCLFDTAWEPYLPGKRFWGHYH